MVYVLQNEPRFNAQAGQDVFVDKILHHQEGGHFVDIGAGTGGLPARTTGFYSNTYFFEKYRNWNGIAIDYDKNWFNAVKYQRTCTCLCTDLMHENINNVLEENNCPDKIDYLSIDVDDAQWTVFDELDWDKYKFKILTLEHNLFQSFEDCGQNHGIEHREKIKYEYAHYRERLTGLGYKILWGNVILDDYGPVEDWWVNEEVFEICNHLQKENINYRQVHNLNPFEGSINDNNR